MNKTGRTWRAALLVVAAVVGLVGVGPAAAGTVDGPLAAKLEELGPDAFVRVFVSMEDQPDGLHGLGADGVQAVLQQTAARTQAPVVQYLQTSAVRGDVATWNQFWIANVAFAEIRAGKVPELAALPGVARVFEDVEVTAVPAEVTPVDVGPQDGPLLWDHLAAVFAPEVWDLGYKGQDVTVAVVDTGIDPTHPELAGALGGEPPYYEGYWAEFDRDGRQIPNSSPYDTQWHGTHVSGTVGGRNVHARFGVAPEVTLAHGLVIPSGSGTLAQVFGGFQWVIEQGFDIINGSLGLNAIVPEMAVATDNLYAAGVVPIFANGNILGPDDVPPGAPGNTPSAIAIGSYGSEGQEAELNRGDIVEYPGYEYDEFTRIKPDLSGPGEDILSAYPYEQYARANGTSMAAPHAAGVVALMLSANPDLTVDEIKDALFTTTGGHESFGWEDVTEKNTVFGWGRINALQAVQAVLPSETDAPVAGVVSSGGEPVWHATVVFDGPEEKTFVTDRKGAFAGALTPGDYVVTAAANGYVTSTQQVRLAAGGAGPMAVDFDLELDAPGHVVGTVADEFGAALTGVSVHVVDANVQTTTDETGRYTLELGRGVHPLRFVQDGFFAEEREVVIVPEQAVQVDAYLAFGRHTVVGTVSDRRGEPVAGTTVRAGDAAAVTDPDGAYGLDLPVGEYDVVFEKFGYKTSVASATVEHGRVVVKDVQLASDLGAVTGTVRDMEGTPVPDVVVSIPELDLITSTDGSGVYILEGVLAGPRRVEVENPLHWPQAGTVVVEAETTTTYDVTLQAFTVLFENSFDTEEEQAEWTLSALMNPLGWHFTDRDSASPPYAAWHGDPNTGAYPTPQLADMTTPSLELPKDGSILLSFNMTSLTAPLHGLTVQVVNPDTNWFAATFLWSETYRLPWTNIVVDLTDFLADERFTSSAHFQVRFRQLNSGPLRPIDTGTFIDDVKIVATIAPLLDAAIEGTVRDEAGNPVAGAAVTVHELEAAGPIGRMSVAVTDEEGRYSLSVPAGGWTVQALKLPDFVGPPQVVYAAPDEVSEADFVVEKHEPPAAVAGLEAEVGDGSVRLQWQALPTASVSGYSVYKKTGERDFVAVGTTADSRLTVDGLENGREYTFLVRAIDVYGLEGEGATVEATPTDTTPAVRSFDVQPRAQAQGGPLTIRAVIEQGLLDDAGLDVELVARRNGDIVAQWNYEEAPTGVFEAAVETVDTFGRRWPAGIYGFTLSAANARGEVGVSDTVHVALMGPLPQALSFLLDNNPFDPSRESQRIEYALPTDGRVNVSVYSLDGRRLTTVLDESAPAGRYAAYWDGTDDAGASVLGGMYVVQVTFTDADGEQTVLTRHSVVVK